MKIVTLLENTACREDLRHAHGLSLYIKTARHKLLFDMGPNGDFLENAQALGVDLAAVDTAVLSHGHYDHGGGLAAFCRLNSAAPIYIQQTAFGGYYALEEGGDPRYIGLPAGLEEFQSRFRLTGVEAVIDDELTLFSDPPTVFDGMSASAALQEKVDGVLRTDGFSHEQSLLLQTEGRAVLVAGCAHRGIVNILAAAERRLGRRPDAVFGGFHFFELDPADPNSARLVDDTGRALLTGHTVYYTGHCTGTWAYDRLAAILGDRLRPMTGGGAIEL